MFVYVPSVRLDDFSFNDNASVYPVSKVCPISSRYVVVMRKMSKYTVFVLTQYSNDRFNKNVDIKFSTYDAFLC
jgi:hypothetical protein